MAAFALRERQVRARAPSPYQKALILRRHTMVLSSTGDSASV
jgi:hypothetical protein